MEDKKYFKPGDLVKCKLPNSPVMLVLKKEMALFKDNPNLKGIRCRWFTASHVMQEAVFDTHDIDYVES